MIDVLIEELILLKKLTDKSAIEITELEMKLPNGDRIVIK